MGILDLVVGPILDIVNKVIPTPMTPEQKAQIQLATLQLQQNDEFKQIDSALAASAQQTDTDKVEAASTSTFVAGWRPFIGWVCGSGLAYQFIANPLLSWVSLMLHGPAAPTLDTQTLLTLLGGMLGFGYMRSKEKLSGLNPGQ